MSLIVVSTRVGGDEVDVGDITYTQRANGAAQVRFQYDRDFLAHGYPIEPGLPLDAAPHTLPLLPLAVLDASPDLWGRNLLTIAERRRAEEEGRASKALTEADFLLAAADRTRQGALRFRVEQDGPHLASDDLVPAQLDLGALLAAADKVVEDPNGDVWSETKQLLGVGTGALGGARPKAAVTDASGSLWIAKFPQRGELHDVPAWEMVALDIAARAGVEVPERRLVKVDGRNVLLVRRFDREADGSRVPYISARTLMGEREVGATGDYGAIVRRLRRESADPDQDAERLWQQALVHLLVNNTDNHLRNQGFLRRGNGWAVAPIFDVEPTMDLGATFTGTHFGGAAQRSTGVRGLYGIRKDFGISEALAKETLEQLTAALTGWEADAERYGIGAREIDQFQTITSTPLVPGAAGRASG